ncbi:DUF6680 family protein [Desulfomicrobium apsheronum]|uniref:DUF6680 family protein n=1 Tax=Desulfomicrobium apsheronum TaxID=52560 RepID=UPI0011601389|nr:DUF6680 family protein [Desulfomicrobium apsheronum]
MTTAQILITILSSLISGMVAVIVSTVFYVFHELRKDKLETLRRFVGNRYDIRGDEFSRALNEVFVVFEKSPKVIAALSEYHKKIITRQNSEDELIKLFKAMCNDVNLGYSDFNDSFFLPPFNTRSNCSMSKNFVKSSCNKNNQDVLNFDI